MKEEILKLSPKEGDIIVVKIDTPLSGEEISDIQNIINNVTLIFLPKDTEISILSEEEKEKLIELLQK